MIPIINFNNFTHNPILEGAVFNDKIYVFFHSSLGHFEGLGHFGVGTFRSWDVLKLGHFEVGTF
jgi:hypothetical protein